ncbi:6-aminohexanoate-cyclic-dimer hydrolase (plasmid) [Azospirillum sp. B510]|uniref:amidase n=2 Tax=Alphaproteobacteria TaxID=28211 RepID=UPI0001C4BBE5|nr:amidase [Azospirillum sp. B510]BAI74431.1 6-aminohexanoate-cyclic-dimer hydrolase [Azospirillum sp. B510]
MRQTTSIAPWHDSWRDGLDLAERIQAGEVTPLEALDDAIARLERVNPTLNAVVEPLFETARETASRRTSGDGPFAGVPTFIKDLFMPVAGARMTNGSRLFEPVRAPVDADFVQRLRQAGIVIAGTTTSPEFGTSFATESQLFGATRNPWSPDHTPGGSSGGASALVAARVVPFAYGNDGGGSLRVPASCCGVFGLKPTRGRVPLGPMIGEGWAGMGVTHAITLSVRDSAALLDATAGYSAGDPYAAPTPDGRFLDAVTRPPKPLRIGLVRSLAPWPTHPDCLAAVDHSVRLCESLGHRVEETELPVSAADFYDAIFTIIGAQTRHLLEVVGAMTGRPADESVLEPRTRVLLRAKGGVSGAAYAAAVDSIHALGRRMAGLFGRFDVLLTPTLAKPPVTIGALDMEDTQTLPELIDLFHSFSPITPLFNATGQPAMSVPLHWNDAGLPIGTQFAAPFGEESLLFALAGQLEDAQPWRDRVPPINALQGL